MSFVPDGKIDNSTVCQKWQNRNLEVNRSLLTQCYASLIVFYWFYCFTDFFCARRNGIFDFSISHLILSKFRTFTIQIKNILIVKLLNLFRTIIWNLKWQQNFLPPTNNNGTIKCWSKNGTERKSGKMFSLLFSLEMSLKRYQESF